MLQKYTIHIHAETHPLIYKSTSLHQQVWTGKARKLW